MIWRTVRVFLSAQPGLRRWCRVLGNERGATTAEYALLLALIVIVLIGALTELGDVLKERLGDITNQLQTAGN
ncbi:MAG TPA: Flp family type IVb pilin [Thermaerobacter sp.]